LYRRSTFCPGIVTENVGIDIRAKSGTPVQSVLDGVVSTITFIRGYGNIIIIDHGGGFSSVYAQIDNIIVHENEYIQMGNSIAAVATPDNGSSAKIHFEVWGNQKKLNMDLGRTPIIRGCNCSNGIAHLYIFIFMYNNIINLGIH
jgi:murein DD-endopeptidase MepM/ murein hydrolase activator NlpD